MVEDPTDAEIARILRETRRIAVVGASPTPGRPSFGVMRFLLRKGYDVVPVNPLAEGQMLHDRRIVGKLSDAGDVDMVDIFRRSEFVSDIVDEAMEVDPTLKTIWTQLGVRDDASAAKARAAGIAVVQDRCPAIEYPRLATLISDA